MARKSLTVRPLRSPPPSASLIAPRSTICGTSTAPRAEGLAARAATEDHFEGLNAFLEKRVPRPSRELRKIRHIGEVRVTRIEEQMGPGFPAKDFFRIRAGYVRSRRPLAGAGYYQPESGRPRSTPGFLRTALRLIPVDPCEAATAAARHAALRHARYEVP
jgi:hypothetical protein